MSQVPALPINKTSPASPLRQGVDGDAQAQGDAANSNWDNSQTGLCANRPALAGDSVDFSGVLGDLVAAACTGCNASFGKLTQHFYPRLVSFLYKRLGHLQDAEDVAADTLTRAWTQLHKYDSKYQFSTWLYTIARRQAIDFHRRESRGPARETAGHATDHLAAPEVKQVDDRNIWAHASRLLTKEQYSAIWLKYGEELSVAEISQALGKSQVSIRVALHRARKLLAKKLGTS